MDFIIKIFNNYRPQIYIGGVGGGLLSLQPQHKDRAKRRQTIAIFDKRFAVFDNFGKNIKHFF